MCSPQDLQSYVVWTSADKERVVVAGEVVAAHSHDLVKVIYAELHRHPGASRVITGGQVRSAA